jgi:hypothetical protein
MLCKSAESIVIGIIIDSHRLSDELRTSLLSLVFAPRGGKGGAERGKVAFFLPGKVSIS